MGADAATLGPALLVAGVPFFETGLDEAGLALEGAADLGAADLGAALADLEEATDEEAAGLLAGLGSGFHWRAS